MKAQGVFVLKNEEGKTLKVKTIVNDDYSIQSFYENPVNPSFPKRKIPKKQIKLGDWVKKTIDFFTYKKVKPCGVCKKRQAMLNQLMQKEQTNG
tara:strand:- start:46 stop:327 length:282 start_codon:yes stop_codon:yes gene_type:complete